ncbi:MAG: 50S ribosomal protein L29 [Gammaproteobacteria bacterium]|nr:50S ribosomal protein L29 [Gammaproteobacteria bacterium]
MKAKDIRALSAEDRLKELENLRREQFNVRMQHATGQMANNSKLKVIRRDIARLKTVMNEKAG